MLRTLVACAFIAGCSSSAPAPTTPTPPPPPTGTDTPSAPSTQGLGEKCAENGCQTGQACVHYFGIAGPKGPEFTSCEIACADGAACPEGTTCITIADGPGQVCRPASAP